MQDEPRATGLLLQLAKALATRPATVAWAKGLTQDDLESVWKACPDGRALMRLCAPVTSPQVLVRGACACIRLALDAQGKERRRVRAAVDQLEAWSQGTATWAQVATAGDKANAELAGGSSDVMDALLAAAGIPSDPARAMDAIDAVALSLADDDTVWAPSFANVGPPRRTKRAVLAELADLVRATIPCPSVEQVARDPAPGP